MRTAAPRFLGLLALLGAAAGCSDAPTYASDETAQLAVAFDGMAADANRVGDAEGAAALSAGSLALRMGARPTTIEVVIGGESVRHYALVAAVTHTVEGQSRLLRTLFAWTGERRPTSILEVGILGEQGSFHPAASTQPVGRARGVYRHHVNQTLWFASTGTASIAVAGTGEACGRPLSDNPNIQCVTARFDVRVNGVFHRRSTDRAAAPVSDVGLTIATQANGVNGVVVGPAGN